VVVGSDGFLGEILQDSFIRDINAGSKWTSTGLES
jgi:hypothetical protein